MWLFQKNSGILYERTPLSRCLICWDFRLSLCPQQIVAKIYIRKKILFRFIIYDLLVTIQKRLCYTIVLSRRKDFVFISNAFFTHLGNKRVLKALLCSAKLSENSSLTFVPHPPPLSYALPLPRRKKGWNVSFLFNLYLTENLTIAKKKTTTTTTTTWRLNLSMAVC